MTYSFLLRVKLYCAYETKSDIYVDAAICIPYDYAHNAFSACIMNMRLLSSRYVFEDNVDVNNAPVQYSTGALMVRLEHYYRLNL